MIVDIFVLLVAFQIKHFLADYIYQNAYMLGKFKEKGWVLPLLSHVSFHGVFTIAIAAFYVTNWWIVLGLALFDMIIHFIMDRIKASPKMLGRFNATQKEFWWSLGLDQMVHHLTHYAIIAFIVLL